MFVRKSEKTGSLYIGCYLVVDLNCGVRIRLMASVIQGVTVDMGSSTSGMTRTVWVPY